MLLLLMLSGVLADAGYHYNIPRDSFHLPSEQPANFRSGQSSSDGFNQGDLETVLSNSGFGTNRGIEASHSSYYDHAQTRTPVGFTINTDYSQPLKPIDTLNQQYTSSSSTASVSENSYRKDLNNGYASMTNNFNFNGPSQTPGNTENSYNTLPQTLLPPLESNLNSDVTQAQPTYQNLDSLNRNNFITSGASNINNAAPVPTVIKHIYVHVPSPDFEEQAVTQPLPQPKKIYKILFIKMPSFQESSNAARLQQLIQSRNAGVEEKTLVYVLVKKADPHEPVVIPQTKSNHEVFFVKYKDNPTVVASKINDGLEQAGSAESVPRLQPGLVNGHKWDRD